MMAMYDYEYYKETNDVDRSAFEYEEFTLKVCLSY